MPGVEEGCGRGVGTEGGDGGLDEVKVQSVHWPSGLTDLELISVSTA